MPDLMSEWQCNAPRTFIKDAACKGLDPNMFMPGVGETGREAKEVCNGIPATRNNPGKPPCPVKKECLEYALALPGPVFGVWGGLNERQRRRFMRDEPIPQPTRRFNHGTNSGYQQHLNAKTTPCQACRDAHTATTQAWRDKNRDNLTMPALRHLMILVHQENAASRTS